MWADDDYKPGSLLDDSGNPVYEFGTLDSGDFCYSYWMSTYLTSLLRSSKDLVRQSVVPSAMVDANGDLFAMSLYGLSGPSGAKYRLARYRANERMVSCVESIFIYPWASIGTSINVTENPSNIGSSSEKRWLDCFVCNAFQPCIAQDVSDACNMFSMLWYVPPTRHMNASQNEGILYQVRRKDNLSSVFWNELYSPDTTYSYGNVCNQYAFHHLKTRNYDASKYAFGSETGNFSAASMSVGVNDCYTQFYYCGLAEEENHETGRIFNIGRDCIGSNVNVSGLKVYHRYIKWGDRCYGMHSMDGNRYFRTFSFFVGSGFERRQGFSVDQSWASAFKYLDHSNKSSLNHDDGSEWYTPYNYDFCIVNGNNEVGIMCMLGLRATGLSSSKTYLTPSYNSAWNYISWGQQDICLMLSSCRLGYSPNYCYEDPQNMIYSTGVTSGSACNIGCGCYSTFSSQYGQNQLFKNTHKCCAYKSSLGNQYIIYCYCYPGRKPQLYLGYALCCLDSNNKVRLGIKFEFRQGSDPWSNSFGLFTSCARIISMDCRNGHVWITWLNKSDSKYYYFHILAKDLVGE